MMVIELHGLGCEPLEWASYLLACSLGPNGALTAS